LTDQPRHPETGQFTTASVLASLPSEMGEKPGQIVSSMTAYQAPALHTAGRHHEQPFVVRSVDYREDAGTMAGLDHEPGESGQGAMMQPDASAPTGTGAPMPSNPLLPVAGSQQPASAGLFQRGPLAEGHQRLAVESGYCGASTVSMAQLSAATRRAPGES
jgi:hypothetical protein